jgi:hypothetical protein
MREELGVRGRGRGMVQETNRSELEMRKPGHSTFSGRSGLSQCARINDASKLARFSFLEGHPCWSTCGRRTRLQMNTPSLLVISSGMGADRSSTARVQRGESATARCASTEDHQAPSRPLFCEQEGHLTAPSLSLPAALAYPIKGGLVDPLLRALNEHIHIVRVPRAGGRPGCPSSPIVR